MTAAAVHDALAAKLATLASLQVAYGDGSTNTAIKPWPAMVIAMPSVLVQRGQTVREAGLSREMYKRDFEGHFYLPLATDPGRAIQRVNELDDQILVEFRTGVSLGGLVTVVRYLGSAQPVYREEGEDDDRLPYLVWITRFQTEERAGVTYTT